MLKSFNNFFNSLPGQITTVVVMFVLLILVAMSGKKKRFDVKVMIRTALMIALGFVLNQLTIFKMPQGGSVTPFSMLIIVLIGYLYGPRQGILAGMTFGLLDLAINPWVIHPIQMLLDYPLAFGALGVGSLLRNQKHGLIKDYSLSIICRFIMNVLSGVIFFGADAPEGFNGLTWSLVYNITYIGTEGIITIVILCIPGVVKFFDRFKEAN